MSAFDVTEALALVVVVAAGLSIFTGAAIGVEFSLSSSSITSSSTTVVLADLTGDFRF